MKQETAIPADFDHSLDLLLQREIDVPVEKVWQAWTQPEKLKQWFTPKPWKTAECVIDLRPGGRFFTLMESPEGEQHPNEGCYLEIVENSRLVFTDALGAEYRPNASSFMTATVILAPTASGTRYTAIAKHASGDSKQKHEEMGFHNGWSSALDQLIALCNKSG